MAQFKYTNFTKLIKGDIKTGYIGTLAQKRQRKRMGALLLVFTHLENWEIMGQM